MNLLLFLLQTPSSKENNLKLTKWVAVPVDTAPRRKVFGIAVTNYILKSNESRLAIASSQI